MNKRLARFGTSTVQAIQERRLQLIYDALQHHEHGSEVIDRLNASYNETVQVLLERLGHNASCYAIDQDKSGFFSDMFKDEFGWRPRHWTYREMIAWMDQKIEQGLIIVSNKQVPPTTN